MVRAATEEIRRLVPRCTLLGLYGMRDLADRHLLTLNEVIVLAELLVRGRPLDGATVADAVGLGSGGTCRLLARLEERDLVVREPDPDDGRRLLVSASDAARLLLWHDLLVVDPERLLAPVPTDRIEWATGFLGRIADLGVRRVQAMQDRRAGKRRLGPPADAAPEPAPEAAPEPLPP